MNTSRRSRWLRPLIKFILLSVLVIVLGACAIAWFLLSGSRADLNGERRLSGLQDSVTIDRDALGTVTLQGKSRNDIGFALGYAHAQERYFAMDLMRRLPAGELAELVGKAAVDVDLNHRRHRLRAIATAAYANMSPAEKDQLDRYRDGVNAGLAHLRVRPWEYLLLGTRPQPWRSEDSLLVVAAMYLDLNGDGRNETELRFAQMRAALPEPLVDFLLAPDPNWEAPLKGDLSRQPVVPGADVFDLRHQPQARINDVSSLAQALSPALDDARPGSNSFAVAGNLTESGVAMLANDMHLSLRVPNIWFRARLRYADPTAPNGQRDVNGVTLPGTPALIAGSNGQVAWGFTNSYGDWQDWVRVQRDPADPTRYKVPEGWASIEPHDEQIRIKGEAPRSLKVEDTRWGPIMATDTDGTPLALSWIGDLPRAYNLNTMQLEHAGNIDAALDLASNMGMPPQNLLVADSAGHIGWTVTGNSWPLRAGFDPQRPADWSQPGSGWIGWATSAQYPRIENPEDGRLWTANNRTVDGADLALLGSGGYDLGARAQQIRDDLRAGNRFTPGSLLDVQLDHRALWLNRWQRLLQDTLTSTNDPDLQQLRQLTASWQGLAAVDSVDYRLVRAFRTQVVEAVLTPFVAQIQETDADFRWPKSSNPEAAVWMLLRDRPAHLLDRHYANWDELLVAAAHDVVKKLASQPGGLAARTWGEVNRSGVNHPLARALPGPIARLLNMPDEPLPGDHNMPRVAEAGFGASERLVVMPGREAQSILHMPGGQSDHPLSPFYGAGHEDWVHGVPTPLLPGPTKYTLTLAPTSQASP
jgi:penicillin amidase